MSFYQKFSSKTEDLEVWPMASVCSSVLLWRRRAEAQELTTWSEDALSPLKNNSPSWSALGRGGTASLGTKEPRGHH